MVAQQPEGGVAMTPTPRLRRDPPLKGEGGKVWFGECNIYANNAFAIRHSLFAFAS